MIKGTKEKVIAEKQSEENKHGVSLERKKIMKK
jgi:hypothetical protein